MCRNQLVHVGGVTGRYRGWDVDMGVMTAETPWYTLSCPKKVKKKFKKLRA